jgi:catechol 2,3-dioxygenase-like lactoylglutathione lyase family enzyme
MRIAGLDHIVLNVADVERSLGFYNGCLGLPAERVEEWRRGTLPFPSVRINDATIIDLVKTDPDAPRGAPNLNHFCLVTADADLDEISDALGRAGVPIENGPAIRSGARGDALSIYFRDPDHNQIEVRTYARRPLLRIAIEQSRLSVHAAIDALETPDAPVPGNEEWSHKDLIAHLTSVEGWIRKRVEVAINGQPPDPETSEEFNARAIPDRRDWSMQQLSEELDQGAAALQELLETLDEAQLERVIVQPGRPPRKLADRMMLVYTHTRSHLADLRSPAR